MSAFIFQGAGTVFRKYLENLDTKTFERLEKCCKLASKETGMNVFNYIRTGSAKDWDEELLDQIVIYSINCCIFETYIAYGYIPRYLLAYSMGIYSALASGGAYGFEDGLRLVIKAYECMKRSMGALAGGMASIIGFNRKDIEHLIGIIGAKEKVEIVNENNEYSIVVSGIKEYVEALMEMATEEGALKVLTIKTNIAYHSKFISGELGDFEEYVNELKLKHLKFPIISSIRQNVVKNDMDIRNELCLNLKSPLSWRKTIEKACSLGVYNFLEVGLGASLTRVSVLNSSQSEFLSYKKIIKENKEWNENLA
ncbi:MAG TPA: ACP S-malonyltransferase [Clostridia bacterium]|nr:ACP S-malonyltransferase [Clostridia bacterium]